MGWLNSERFHQVERILWAAVLVALPVTTFRYMPLMGDAQVKPLSLIPAVLLLFVMVLMCFQKRRIVFWSGSLQPLVLFILVAMISTAVGFYLAPIKLYSTMYGARVLRAWVSLGVGLVFLIDSIHMNRNETDLIFSIKWIYVGFVAEIVWSLMQQILSLHVLNSGLVMYTLMENLQRFLTNTGLPPNHRVSGLALEPSWLAAQILTLYLPWAVASLIKRYAWSKHRWINFAIIAGCAYLLIYSYSRSGIFTAIGVIFITLIIAGWDGIQQVWKWMIAPFKKKIEHASRILSAIFLRITIIVVILAGLAGGIYILSRNSYFAKVWQSNKTTPVAYLVDISAGPRLAYAWAGWTIFTQHPLTGVGLGAAGFSIQKSLPDWAHFNIDEIAQLISPDNTLFPNTKNLYIRLLSETGIIGFWTFITFYLLSMGKILGLLRSKPKYLAFLGTASLIAWMGIVVFGISQDSLAMPIIWLPLGILIGMTDNST